MLDPSHFDEAFHTYTRDLLAWVPDGIIRVDLEFLFAHDQLDVLRPSDNEQESIPNYFRILETNDRVTLFNEHFVVWIVPQPSQTIVLVAQGDGPRSLTLELAFCVEGVYNYSSLILKMLEYFISEIEENNTLLKNLKL